MCLRSLFGLNHSLVGSCFACHLCMFAAWDFVILYVVIVLSVLLCVLAVFIVLGHVLVFVCFVCHMLMFASWVFAFLSVVVALPCVV